MEVRRDDKMRIDLTTPDPRTILRDGDHLYIYNPKIRSVEEYDLSKHRALVEEFLLLGFGTSGDSLKKSYVITFQGEETLGSEKVVHLELTPLAPTMYAPRFPKSSFGLTKQPGCPLSSSFTKPDRAITSSFATPMSSATYDSPTLVSGRTGRMESPEPSRGISLPYEAFFALSCRSRAAFRDSPQRYPPSPPSSRITRWHGISMDTGFFAQALPTARLALG